MPSVSCDIAGQFKSRDIVKILAEARREKTDRTPYRGMDGRVIDPARSHLNRHYRSPRWEEWQGDPRKACVVLDAKGKSELQANGKSLRGRQPLKEDSVILRGIIIQATPEVFYPEMQLWSDFEKQSVALHGKRGKLDADAVDLFWEKTITALREKYGDYLLEAHLHLDESCPHIHAEIIPYCEKKKAVSNNALFPGKKSVSDFHTWLYEKVGKFLSVERSRKDARRDPLRPNYEAPSELLERQLAEREAAVTLLEKKVENHAEYLKSLPPELVLPKPVEPEKPQKPGFFASEEEKHAYETAIELYESKLQEYKKESDPHWRSNEQKKRVVGHLNDILTVQNLQVAKIQSLQKELKQIKSELEFAKQELRKQEVAQLKSIPINEVIEKMYSDILCQDSRDKTIWKTSCGRKIGITGQLFIDNHDATFKGKGAIDFVMQLDNCGVKEAIGKLRDFFGSTEVLQHIANSEPHRLIPVIEAQPSVPEPSAPLPESSKIPALRKWLTQELAISLKTVDFLIQSGQIYADNRANCVVPRPHGGCFMRGTVKLKTGEKNTFKRTSGSKRAGAAVLKGIDATTQSSRAILCEGVTDALALVDLYPDASIYIIGGNLYPDLPSLPGQVLLAFDRDQIGEAHATYYSELYPNAKRLTPPAGAKDWSDWHKLQKNTEFRERNEVLDDTSSPFFFPTS